MEGVVSLLDDIHYALVEDLWAEIEDTLGVKDFYKTPFPHFSYHVAPQYDLTLLSLALKRLAANSSTFTVRVAGLGLFSGPQPVLYLALVRSLALSQFHQVVWQEIEPVTSSSLPYYRTDQWMPHITLADGPVFKEHLSEIVTFCSGQSFTWEIKIDNFAFIYDKGTHQEIGLQVPFANKKNI